MRDMENVYCDMENLYRVKGVFRKLESVPILLDTIVCFLGIYTTNDPVEMALMYFYLPFLVTRMNISANTLLTSHTPCHTVCVEACNGLYGEGVHKNRHILGLEYQQCDPLNEKRLCDASTMENKLSIYKVIEHAPSLRYVSIKKTYVTPLDLTMLGQCLNTNKHLERIGIHSSITNDDQDAYVFFSRALKNHPNLNSLNFNMRGMGHNTYCTFMNNMSNLPALEYLSLQAGIRPTLHAWSTDIDLENVKTWGAKLIDLRLHNFLISETISETIGVLRKLNVLALNKCKITPLGAGVAFDYITHSQIRYLDMTECSGFSSISVFNAVRDMIKYNKTLMCINLNNLDLVCDDMIIDMLEAIKANTSLKEVSLQRVCRLHHLNEPSSTRRKVGYAIADIYEKQPTIDRLHMQSNELTCENLRPIFSRKSKKRFTLEFLFNLPLNDLDDFVRDQNATREPHHRVVCRQGQLIFNDNT